MSLMLYPLPAAVTDRRSIRAGVTWPELVIVKTTCRGMYMNLSLYLHHGRLHHDRDHNGYYHRRPHRSDPSPKVEGQSADWIP